MKISAKLLNKVNNATYLAVGKKEKDKLVLIIPCLNFRGISG
jgi:hypothetical protein